MSAKSKHFAKLLKEKIDGRDQAEIDFNGEVLYEAFKKIVDYLYLDDISILESINDSTEMIEVIRLAKQFQLNDLFRAAEVHFQETMCAWFESSSVFSLRPERAVQLQDSYEEKEGTQHSAQKERSRVTTQVNQQQIQTSGKRRRQNRHHQNTALQGMMFLPDGRVLIMENELYKKTIEQSIVLDLFESGNPITNEITQQEESKEPADTTPAITQTAAQVTASRLYKESNRKQSQANQKRRQTDDQTNASQNGENIAMAQSQVVISEPQTQAQNLNEVVPKQRDFSSILNQREFSDITLMVEGKPIYCHQVVLASRSVYFEAQFSHDFAEKDTRVATYNDVPYEYFFMFLKHVYSDHVKIESKYIYELLSLADRFNVNSFKRKVEQILAQQITIETVCQIFKYANTFNCERLKDTCMLFTEENHNDVMCSAGFEDLDKEEIIKIIRLGNDPKKRKRKQLQK